MHRLISKNGKFAATEWLFHLSLVCSVFYNLLCSNVWGKKKIYMHVCIKEKFSQRSCGVSISWTIPDQVERGFGQPDLVESVPAHDKEVGTVWSLRPLLTQGIPWIHISSLSFSSGIVCQSVIILKLIFCCLLA